VVQLRHRRPEDALPSEVKALPVHHGGLRGVPGVDRAVAVSHEHGVPVVKVRVLRGVRAEDGLAPRLLGRPALARAQDGLAPLVAVLHAIASSPSLEVHEPLVLPVAPSLPEPVARRRTVEAHSLSVPESVKLEALPGVERRDDLVAESVEALLHRVEGVSERLSDVNGLGHSRQSHRRKDRHRNNCRPHLARTRVNADSTSKVLCASRRSSQRLPPLVSMLVTARLVTIQDEAYFCRFTSYCFTCLFCYY